MSTPQPDPPPTPTYAELQARLDALSSRDWQAEIDKAIDGLGLDENATREDGAASTKLKEGFATAGGYVEMDERRREGCCCVM